MRSSHRQPSRRRHGFTLAELLAAVFTLAVTMLSSIMVLQRSFEALDIARNATLAGQLMQSEVEKMRLRNWSDIKTLADTSGGTFTVAPDTAIPEVAQRFNLAGQVAYIPGTNDRLARVSLTATWNSYRNKTHTRTYETLFAADGINDYFVRSF